MTLRSWLFIPADSEKKLAKAGSVAADALILDLEDAVSPARKPAGRELARAFLDARPAGLRAQVWVRINSLDTPHALADLAAVTGGSPDGIVLPKAVGPGDVVRLGHYLDALEAREGRQPGATRILPLTTETAAAPFTVGAYAQAILPRLFGLTWGAEDLAAAIGASTNRDADGDFAFTFRMVRAACLMAARAAGVHAVETIHADFRDLAGLAAHTRRARQEGFTGRLAIHPDQVEPINAAFTPTAEEVAWARKVRDAFAAAPGAGVASLDGRMLDAPHLRQAETLLALDAAARGPRA